MIHYMNDPLPRARISPSTRHLLKNRRSKYLSRVFDEVLFDTTADQFVVPDQAATYEITNFNCDLSLLCQVDLAVHVNASNVVAEFVGGSVTRRLYPEELSMHIISNEKVHYHVICTQPSEQFCHEVLLLESSLFSDLTCRIVEFAADLELTRFVVTDYVSWIFYALEEVDGNIILTLKSIHHESCEPTIRSALLSQLMCAKDGTSTKEELTLRRELGRFVERLKPLETSLYPPFEFDPLPMSRQKPQVEVPLFKDGRPQTGLIDLLHDDINIEYLEKHSSSTHLVSINNVTMVLKTYDSVQTWLRVLEVYSKWLSTLQGRQIPYLYAAVASDPFRGHCRRQLGLLLEYIEGSPLLTWLEAPVFPKHLSVTEGTQIVQTNCTRTLQKIHSLNVASGAVESTFVVHPDDLTVSMIDWDAAKFGGKIERDNKSLARLWAQYRK